MPQSSFVIDPRSRAEAEVTITTAGATLNAAIEKESVARERLQELCGLSNRAVLPKYQAWAWKNKEY